MALYDAKYYPGQPSGFLPLNNGMGVADPMQFMAQNLQPPQLAIPASTFRPLGPAPSAFNGPGLGGTWGDQAGDFPMGQPQLLGANQVPGATGSGTGFFGSIGKWMEDSGFLGKKLADGTQLQGWGGLALGAGSSLLNGWMGMQQYKVARDQLNFQKEAFAKNYGAQRQSMNTQLEDRQRARLASNSGAYESLDSYMKRNAIA